MKKSNTIIEILGQSEKNSITGVIYNWYVLVYLNIVSKVCKNGYTCNINYN